MTEKLKEKEASKQETLASLILKELEKYGWKLVNDPKSERLGAYKPFSTENPEDGVYQEVYIELEGDENEASIDYIYIGDTRLKIILNKDQSISIHTTPAEVTLKDYSTTKEYYFKFTKDTYLREIRRLFSDDKVITYVLYDIVKKKVDDIKNTSAEVIEYIFGDIFSVLYD